MEISSPVTKSMAATSATAARSAVATALVDTVSASGVMTHVPSVASEGPAAAHESSEIPGQIGSAAASVDASATMKKKNINDCGKVTRGLGGLWG